MLFRIHKEGHAMLLVLAATLLAINFVFWKTMPPALWAVAAVSLIVFGLVLQFFRNPRRVVPALDNQIVYAPADGKVCVIEEVTETEYFNDRRLQVSIFMSPINVHVNRNPLSGVVSYFKYHPGKYLVAWHPKSSTENERTTTVYNYGAGEILMRQVAGALAKRIKWYIGTGDKVAQGDDMGFIKFGSRVDLYLPLHAKIEVSMDEHVRGNQTIIARLG